MNLLETIQAQRNVKKTLRAQIQFYRCVIVVGVLVMLCLVSPRQQTRTDSGNSKRLLLAVEEEDADCEPFSIPRVDQCDFIHDNQSCRDLFQDGGFANYAVFYFCDLSVRGFAIPVMIILLLFYFLCLGVSAEDFFSPIMTGISEEFHLSHNVAGVTLLAFANGAPDFFSSFAAFTGNKVLLGFSALFGSSAFVPVIVYGMVAFVSPGFTVTRRPYLRDAIALLIVVSLVYGIIQVGSFNVGTSFSVFFVYIAYAAIVLVGRFIYQRMKAKYPKSGKNSMASELSSAFLSGIPNIIVTTYDSNKTDELTNVAENQSDTSAERTELLTDVAKQNETQQNGDKQNIVLVKTRKPSNMSRTSENRSSIGRNPLLDTYPALTDVQTHAQSILSTIPDKWQGMSRRTSVFSAITSLQGEDKIDQGIFSKFIDFVSNPIIWLSIITIPIPDKEHWDWRIMVLTPTTSLVFFIIAFGFITTTVGGFPVAVIAAIIGLCASAFVYLKIRRDKERIMFVKLFLLLGLLSSVSWIYALANELVNLLAALGTIFGLSQAILGLTVLAWGNSIGDAIANTTIARFGFPRMAIGACFGGPIFNMAVGVGVAMLVNTGKMSPFLVEKSGNLTLAFAEIVLALILHIVVVVACKFKIPKAYGIWNVCLYAAFITFSVLQTTGSINVP